MASEKRKIREIDISGVGKRVIPEWANFMAQDQDGTWWFYKDRPRALDMSWSSDGPAMHVWPEHAVKPLLPITWRHTLIDLAGRAHLQDQRHSPVVFIDRYGAVRHIDRPEWANFVAQDSDGSWRFFEKKPALCATGWGWYGAGRGKCTFVCWGQLPFSPMTWRDTLIEL